MNRKLLAVMLAWAVTIPAARADDDPPLALARDGFFYVGGHAMMVNGRSYVVGQMYVEMRIPANQTHSYPIIMVHGGTRTGTTYTGTPDGRESWAQYFARRGNMTGFAVQGVELQGKRLDLLRELVPAATSIAVLFNSSNRAQQNAARSAWLGMEAVDASRQSDIEPAFAKMAQQRVGAVVVTPDPMFLSYSDQVAALAVRYAIPGIFPQREFVKAGGLISYAPHGPDLARQMGAYAGRILKGERPADLPVQRPTKFELVINLKTAKALGLTVPKTLLVLAVEVIE